MGKERPASGGALGSDFAISEVSSTVTVAGKPPPYGVRLLGSELGDRATCSLRGATCSVTVGRA